MVVGKRENVNMTYVKIIQKKETIDAENEGKPYMLCTNGKQEELSRGSYLNGWFKKIENNTFEWKDGDKTFIIPTYKITLVDGDETFVLECTFSMLSKSLLNSFLSMEQPGKLDISVYMSKKEYCSAWLTNNGEDVKWKYQLNEIPEVIKTPRKNKKDDIDDSDQVAWYETKIDEWNANYKPEVMPQAQRDALNKVAESEPENHTEAPDIEEEPGKAQVSMEEHVSLRDAAIADQNPIPPQEEVMDDLPF